MNDEIENYEMMKEKPVYTNTLMFKLETVTAKRTLNSTWSHPLICKLKEGGKEKGSAVEVWCRLGGGVQLNLCWLGKQRLCYII